MEEDIIQIRSWQSPPHKSTIADRQREYEMETSVDKKSARKRMRAEDDEAHKNADRDGGEHDDALVMSQPLFSPMEHPSDAEDGNDENGVGDDDAEPEYPKSKSKSDWADDVEPTGAEGIDMAKAIDKINKLEAVVDEMKEKYNYLSKSIYVMQKHAFQMDAIHIDNAVFDTTNPDKITTRVVGIFKELGLVAAKNIKFNAALSSRIRRSSSFSQIGRRRRSSRRSLCASPPATGTTRKGRRRSSRR